MSDSAIEVEGLVKVYGHGPSATTAVDHLSFAVKRGSIFGLLGPNGAGKTTTLRVLTTLARPTSGSVRVMGYDVVHAPLEVRRRIGVVIQEQAAELLLNVRDNLLTFARFHGRSGREIQQRARDVMAQLQLESLSERKVQDLSGGVRRRVQVAKMFMVDVPVIFLDEFSTGMDPLLKRRVIDMLRAQAAAGRTIVLTTHIMSEAEELCDDILIIDRGRQLARGDVNALKLLIDRVYDVTLSFERTPADLDAVLSAYQATILRATATAVHLRVRDDESRVLQLVSAVAARARVVRIEINSASLEDVFVELTQKVERR
jgi:ABC-2 type transport system ATP-binding protein